MRRRIPHRIEQGEEEKYCKSCESWYKLSAFNKKAASYDGLETKCKECAQTKSAKFRLSNPDYDKTYQSKHIERLRAYKREYYRSKKLELQ